MSRTHRARSTARPVTAEVAGLLERGYDQFQRGQLTEAEITFRKAHALAPDDLQAAQMLAMAMSDRGDWSDAVEILDRFLERVGPPSEPNQAFYNNYGNALRRAKRVDDAETVLRELVRVAPKDWHGWHNLGQTLCDKNHHHEAVAALRRAVALEPSIASNQALLGEILFKLGRYNSALATLERCFALGPVFDPNVWTVYGNTYRQLGQLHNAVAALRKALEFVPDSANAYSNLGLVLAGTGAFAEAIAILNQAIDMDPQSDAIKANAAYVHLTAGDMARGWDLWRYGILGGPRGYARRQDMQEWSPASPGTRALVYREQGVGDELIFASTYPDMIANSNEVIIESDSRLVSLFQRSFPTATVRGWQFTLKNGELIEPPDYDRIIPCGGLPRWFRRDASQFPGTPYLVPDPERVAAWGERLAGMPRPIIGFSWRSIVKTAERRLEYTQLGEWGDVFGASDATWVNLQYDDCERDLVMAERKFGVNILRWPWLDLKDDFEEVAALMCHLDLVVAPRNAVAMLAGALARPTVMMGNRWDWSDLGTDAFPWCPSIELVTREGRGDDDWTEVLGRAAARVREVATIAAKGNTD
jgi:tetratricopeptide (TPR) repeat protein